MNIRTAIVGAALTALAFTPTSVSAVTVAEVGGSLAAFGWSISGNTITIRETWDAGTSRFVYLEFDGLVPGRNYIVNKLVTNNTGKDWTSFSHELGFGTPGAFLPSDDFDGLSFAQGSGIPRTSTAFASLLTDELATRDYLNWFNGTVSGSGGFVAFSYGLRANVAGNNPFLLKQGLIPEPATWAMLIVGFGLVGYAARRRTTTVTA